MKLWLISQNVNNNWDTYDSAVVAAWTEEDARTTYPDRWGFSKVKWVTTKWLRYLDDGRILDHSPSDWTTPDNVSVKFLANGYTGEAGTIVGSYNAG